LTQSKKLVLIAMIVLNVVATTILTIVIGVTGIRDISALNNADTVLYEEGDCDSEHL